MVPLWGSHVSSKGVVEISWHRKTGYSLIILWPYNSTLHKCHGLSGPNPISILHRSWSFICKSWLSVREDDGRIRRKFPELGQDPRYSIHIRGLPSGVFKRHLVGAVFTKHSRSKYTCAQRVGILFMMFFLIMVSKVFANMTIEIAVLGTLFIHAHL